MSVSCRSVYFTAPRCVEVRTEQIEDRDGAFLIDSRLIGISHGTEMLVYRDEFPRDIPIDETIASYDDHFGYPIRYGYSNVGSCESGLVFCFAPHQDKFYATRDELIVLPEDVTPEDAVFIPNLETALTAVQDAAPRVGDIVVVVGGGVVGQLVSEILLRSHYGKIALIEPLSYRAQFAASRGVPTFGSKDAHFNSWLASAGCGHGADLVIHASGCESGIQTGIDILGFAGTLIEASWYGAKEISLSLGSAFHRKRIRIISCQVSTIAPEMSGVWDKPRRMAVVLDLLAAIKPRYLISHTFPLKDAADAFALIDSSPDQVMQVVIDPTIQE